MLLRVLGSSAGGGFPQWNCNCSNCHGLRAGSLHALPRTQSSIALSTDGRRWALCNASPDIHRQIEAHKGLQPSAGIRDTGIGDILLVDGQIDHSLGILLLREHRDRLSVWTTEAVREDLSHGLPLLALLDAFCGTRWNLIETDGRSFTLPSLPGVTVIALPVDGKAGPYSPHRESPRLGDNIGLIFRVERTAQQVFYAPGLGAITSTVRQAMQASDRRSSGWHLLER